MSDQIDGTTSKNNLWQRYLRRELSDSETYDLQNSLLKNKEAQLILGSRGHDDLSSVEIQRDLTDIKRRWQSRGDQNSKFSNVWIRRVAAALILSFCFWAVFQYYQNQRAYSLYASYFDTNSYLTVRGEFSKEPLFAQALAFYENQDYKKSFAQFQYLTDRSNDPQAYLYAALSAMQLGFNFEAKELLAESKKLPITSSQKAAAYWYLALIYVQENEYDSCKQELMWIGKNTPNGQWATRAKELMEALK